jgi:beta-N-acetylhexosaminidase
LDTTEISKLDAYFCVYGKTEPFTETIVRALFGELTPRGAPPVSVEGAGYELVIQLSPDPNQPLAVRLLEELPESPLPPVTIRVGVGPVLDLNGQPVPDGTTVTFVSSYRASAGPGELLTAATTGGIAEANLSLPSAGHAEIVAQSGEAISHRPLLVTIVPPPTATPTTSPTPTPTISPSATPSATAFPTTTPTPSPTPTATLIPTPVPAETPGEDAGTTAMRSVDGLDLLAALGATLLSGVVGFARRRRPGLSSSRRVRFGLLVLIGGLASYLLYGAGWLRPEMWLVAESESRLAVGRLSVAALAFIFGLLSLVLERPQGGGQFSGE